MSDHVRVLIVEDSLGDAELDVMTLESSGFKVDYRRVETEPDFLRELKKFEPEIVLSDHSMPRFDALRALHILQNESPDIPFVVVSGQIGEVAAVNLMRAGASDYVIKDSLVRLPPVVRRELRESRLRRRGEKAERRLAENERMMQNLMNNLPGAVYRLQLQDGLWRFDFASRGFETLLGRDPEALMGDDGDDFSEMLYTEDRQQTLEEIERLLSLDNVYTLEHRIIDAEGEVKWVWNRGVASRDSDGNIVDIEGFIADITERKLDQAKLDYLAHHDVLTGLANRTLFEAELSRAMARAMRHGSRVALLFIDLDGFKDVNDSWGHPLGDALLRAAAERLTRGNRSFDLVARLGGDEFALVVDDFETEDDVASMGSKVLEELAKPYQLDGHEFRVTASIGIALYPDDGSDVAELLRCADAAMYKSKDAGRNAYRFFTSEMNERARELVNVRVAVPAAIKAGEFELEYQPQVNLQDNSIECVEALLRWNHPRDGRLSAGEFIERAEETGVITQIDEWVVSAVAKQARIWKDAGVPFGRIAFNLSARSLRRTELPEILNAALVEFRIDGSMLELEITETGMMHDMHTALDNLNAVAALGVQATLDDFGKGYSSLNYLKRFPITRLKIDRDFVSELPQNTSDGQICRAIIALAASLDIGVVAEGIESPEQAGFLLEHGCSVGQGYLFYRPMPLGDCVKALHSASDVVRIVN